MVSKAFNFSESYPTGAQRNCIFRPELSKIVGLAWDCGVVTTGNENFSIGSGYRVAAAAGKGADYLIRYCHARFCVSNTWCFDIELLHRIHCACRCDNRKAAEIKAASAMASAKTQWHETTLGLRQY